MTKVRSTEHLSVDRLALVTDELRKGIARVGERDTHLFDGAVT